MGSFRLELVTDSSVLIDLCRGKIPSDAFKIDFSFVAPDVLIADELHEPDRGNLKRLGLKSRVLPGDQVAVADKLAEKYQQPTRNDLFALALAKADKAILLTGDGNLRKAADEEGVEVHGTLWLLDRMVEQQAISRARAATALETMVKCRSRLPKHEVERRLRRWRR
jgi:predicted nucleic acid-binding protein